MLQTWGVDALIIDDDHTIHVTPPARAGDLSTPASARAKAMALPRPEPPPVTTVALVATRMLGRRMERLHALAGTLVKEPYRFLMTRPASTRFTFPSWMTACPLMKSCSTPVAWRGSEANSAG